jgi:hypothetical protein
VESVGWFTTSFNVAGNYQQSCASCRDRGGVRVLLSAWVLKPQAAEDHTLDLLPHNLHHAVGVTVWPH